MASVFLCLSLTLFLHVSPPFLSPLLYPLSLALSPPTPSLYLSLSLCLSLPASLAISFSLVSSPRPLSPPWPFSLRVLA